MRKSDFYNWDSVCHFEELRSGWVTGCKARVKPNKFWLFCPYCGKRIIWLSSRPK